MSDRPDPVHNAEMRMVWLIQRGPADQHAPDHSPLGNSDHAITATTIGESGLNKLASLERLAWQKR